MIGIYCKDMHNTEHGLCDKCKELQNYALKRIELCPFKIRKPACKNCKVYCYSPEKRETIRKVMRHSGKKMVYRHPLLSIAHLLKKASF